MKTTFKTLVFTGFAVAVIFSACQKDILSSDNARYASILDVSNDGKSTLVSQNLLAAFIETPVPDSSSLLMLSKIREEEKLARDVYTALFEKWNSLIFDRISGAEENHMNAVISLLKYYGSSDTVAGEPGIFSDATFQALYSDLVAKGTVSVEEAYKTGLLIEELDIRDISDDLEMVTNENIKLVFENLLKGSHNHLRAFYRQLTSLGITYTPVYLTQDEYDRIAASSFEKGRQYNMKGNGNNGSCDGTGQQLRKGRN